MTPSERYRADLARDGFHADSAQARTVDLLQSLYESLQRPQNPFARLRRLWPGASAPRGLYLWGSTGRGKTYLMDCFHDSLPRPEKRRVHFHRFMLEVHHALDRLPKTPDPLPVVAARIVRQQRVLCLDEFHVGDVADAMLLAGLLEGMFRRGLVIVATSNTPPDELYRDGLQRDRFLPAVELLKTHLQVVRLDGERDFRIEHLQSGGTYRVIEDGQSRDWLGERLRELAPAYTPAEADIEIAGRRLRAEGLCEDAAWFRFAELCQCARSVRDYLELAREFPTLLLQGVPQMGDEQDEAVRRFIHLVDALYDHGVKLVVTAAARPERLYTGTRLREPFQRTVSRLTEMSGSGYLGRAHRTE